MNKSSIRISLLAAIILFVHIIPVQAFASGLSFGGWIPYWRAIPGIVEVNKNIKKLDSINPFIFEISKETGKLVDKGSVDAETWSLLYTQAKKNKIPVYPSILWTNAAQMHTTLTDAKKRKAHIDDIDKTILKDKRFAGVDVDYEGKFADTREGFSQFLTELSRRTKARKKKLICTVESRTPVSDRFTVVNQGVLDSIKYSNDYAVIGRVCDEVRIMTYDQGAIDVNLNAEMSGDHYLPVADVRWVEKVIVETLKDIPANKIHLGLATYGYVFEATPTETGTYTYRRMRAVNTSDVQNYIKQYSAKPVRNSSGEMSFEFTKPDAPGKTYIVWYSDARAMNDKIALAKKYKLAGVSVFKFDGDTPAGMWGVVDKKIK
jgi:spore germination protein YaaH